MKDYWYYLRKNAKECGKGLLSALAIVVSIAVLFAPIILLAITDCFWFFAVYLIAPFVLALFDYIRNKEGKA